MQPAKLPENEHERLAALRECEILDTLPEQAYDDITYMASRLCRTPIALVSLIDSERQWFKSKVGLDVDETPRALAFCAHAISEHLPLFVVPDASRDERFADNPLVTHAPKIRFYAGAPLVTSDGHALGTLCVIDREPRELSSDQKESLAALSRQVVAHLELRRTVAALEIASRELADANEALERRGSQVERSRDELAELCRMLEVQAELTGRDLQRAEVIQRSLLPREAPDVPNVRIQALYQPGRAIGGDLYDVAGIAGRYLALVMADAAGHGVSAALLSVLFKNRISLRDEASDTPRHPAVVLDELNRSLFADLSAPGAFVTAIVAVLDTREGRLRLASAGHPPALVLRADGGAENLPHTGPALGLYGDAHYEEHEVRLDRGDRLLLYTDGIFDAAGDDSLDLARVAARLHALREEKDVLAAVLAEIFTGHESVDFDDVTLLLVETTPGESRFCVSTPREVAGDARTETPPITYGENADGTYLGLHGRVGWMHATSLLNAALAVVEAKRSLAIDLRDCVHLDSTLLGTLHEIVERADASGVPLRLCAPGPKILDAFDELSLHDVTAHVSGTPAEVPADTSPLAMPAPDPQRQKLRLLKAHEVLAELDGENRAELSGVVDAARSDLTRR